MAAKKSSRERFEETLDSFRAQLDAHRRQVRPEDGYWFWRPHQDFPPEPIHHPDDLPDSKRLSLACTQLPMSQHQQMKLVNEWCDLLPSLELDYLWLTSRASQKLLEAASLVQGLKGLWIEWGALTSAEPLRNCQTLEALYLGSCPSISGLGALSELPNLLWLEVEGARSAQDLSFVSNITSLMGFGVGASFNGAKITLDSLHPIRGLEELEWLRVRADIKDKNLSVLASLPKLRFAGLPDIFPLDEIACLAAFCPDLRCPLFEVVQGSVGCTCRKCGGGPVVRLVGKRGFWCRDCDSKQISDHEDLFEELLGEYSRSM